MIKNIRRATTISEATRIDLDGKELLELICHVFDLDPTRTAVLVNTSSYDAVTLDGNVDIEITQMISHTEEAAPSKTDLTVPPVPVAVPITKPSIASPPRGAPPPIPFPSSGDEDLGQDQG